MNCPTCNAEMRAVTARPPKLPWECEWCKALEVRARELFDAVEPRNVPRSAAVSAIAFALRAADRAGWERGKAEVARLREALEGFSRHCIKSECACWACEALRAPAKEPAPEAASRFCQHCARDLAEPSQYGCAQCKPQPTGRSG